MARHPLLNRQIQRYLESHKDRLTPDLLAFLDAVDATYKSLEGQRVFLRQIIDQSPDFIFVKDSDGRFRLVNQAVADAFGLTIDGVLGKTDYDFQSNVDQVESHRKDDQDVLATLSEKSIPETAVTDRSGNTRWLQTIKRPILSPEGREQMVLGVAMDITARKLA